MVPHIHVKLSIISWIPTYWTSQSTKSIDVMNGGIEIQMLAEVTEVIRTQSVEEFKSLASCPINKLHSS